MRTANVTVPQGLGDIFWIYRKLYNYFDRFNLSITITDPNNTIENRSVKLLSDLPKVESIDTVVWPRERQAKFWKSVPKLDELYPDGFDGDVTFEYICNKWLEDGRSLETLDRYFDVAWEFSLPDEPVDLPERYVILYVSGGVQHLGRSSWRISDWALLPNAYFQRKEKCPVVLIGAEFDRWSLDKMKKILLAYEIETIERVDLNLGQMCHVINNAEMLMGYQSGLNILADHLDTRQLMVYFNHLPWMRETWVKPPNRTNGLFTYAYFHDSAEFAMDRHFWIQDNL